MNRTSPASRPVRSPARSPGFSRTGPLVTRIFPPISRARMWASVVLPRPGGPENRQWPRGSPRWRAASIEILRFCFSFSCPANSSSVRGRSVSSNASSSGATASGRVACRPRIEDWNREPLVSLTPDRSVSSRAILLPDRRQRATREIGGGCVRSVGERRLDRALGGGPADAECDQRLDRVLPVRRQAHRLALLGLDLGEFADLVLELQHKPLGGLAPHAADQIGRAHV